MQAIDLFGFLVAAVGIVHLFSRIAARLTGVSADLRRKSSKDPVARTDWYVFFSLSSLYGNQRAHRNTGGTARYPGRQHRPMPHPGSTRTRPRATLTS
jgi:hypothetical protein